MSGNIRTNEMVRAIRDRMSEEMRHLSFEELEAYLAARTARGCREAYDAILTRVPDVEPDDADRL